MESFPAARQRLLRCTIGLALGLLAVMVWFSAMAAAPRAVTFQQDIPSLSPSPSLTSSASVSPTLTATLPTATETVTASPTLASQTSTAPIPPTASATWTFPAPILATTVAPIPSEPVFTPTPASPTATLLPLPTVTYQFPRRTPPGELYLSAHPEAETVWPKEDSSGLLRVNPGPGWFLWLVLALWGGLIAWFVIAQIVAHRR